MQNITQTPLPLSSSIQHLDDETVELMRTVREWLAHPGHLEGGEPQRLAAYCLDLLEMCEGGLQETAALEALQVFRQAPRTRLQHLTQEVLGELLSLFFKEAWCRETAIPRVHDTWSPQSPWVGQEVVTALLVQKLLGGQVEYKKSLEEGRLCIWVRLNGIAINPSWRKTTLPREPGMPVDEGALWKKQGLAKSVALLERRLMTSLVAWGMAAACLAEQNGWQPPPPDDWRHVG